MKKLVALKMLNLCFAISFIGHYAILISRLVWSGLIVWVRAGLGLPLWLGPC